jgi:hypothetical protein
MERVRQQQQQPAARASSDAAAAVAAAAAAIPMEDDAAETQARAALHARQPVRICCYAHRAHSPRSLSRQRFDAESVHAQHDAQYRQALRDELSRLRRHCAALQTRVTDLESAPPATARKRRRAGHADDDEDDDEDDDALFSAPSPPTPRLASWLAHVQTHLRSAPRGERLAVDVAALEADVAARGAAMQNVVRAGASAKVRPASARGRSGRAQGEYSRPGAAGAPAPAAAAASTHARRRLRGLLCARADGCCRNARECRGARGATRRRPRLVHDSRHRRALRRTRSDTKLDDEAIFT